MFHVVDDSRITAQKPSYTTLGSAANPQIWLLCSTEHAQCDNYLAQWENGFLTSSDAIRGLTRAAVATTNQQQQENTLYAHKLSEQS